MKKILSLLLALTLIFAFTACGEKKGDALESGASSLTQTETESTNTESEENSSVTEVPNSSSENTQESKPTSNSKPNNTTSSKPSTPTTSKPTASAPTASTPAKPSLPFDDTFYGGNALAMTDTNASGLTANRILNRSCWEIFHAYIFDNIATIESRKWSYQIGDTSFALQQYAVPESVVYQYASMFFNIDASAKNLLKTSDRYDSAKGIYWICPPDVWFTGIDAAIKGYESLGNNEYILYAQARGVNHPGAPCSECATTNSCVIAQPYFKAKIKAAEKSGFIVLSFEYTDNIPNNITKI